MTSNHQDQELAGGDIVDLLRERHEQIRDAFADVIAAEGPVKAALFDELVTTLAVREAVAQELIRPVVELQRPVVSAVRTGPAAEEPEIMSQLSGLSTMDVDDDEFDAELIGVARIVTLHIEAQERDDLPLLRRSLPDRELTALAELMLSAETIATASAGAIQTENTSPDVLGPRRVFAALGNTIRRANRP